jgi:hypothetical protein
MRPGSTTQAEKVQISDVETDCTEQPPFGRMIAQSIAQYLTAFQRLSIHEGLVHPVLHFDLSQRSSSVRKTAEKRLIQRSCISAEPIGPSHPHNPIDFDAPRSRSSPRSPKRDLNVAFSGSVLSKGQDKPDG